MFENLKKAVNEYYDAKEKEFANALDQNMSTGYALDHWYYRDRMTKAAYAIATKTDREALLPDACKAKMLARFRRENEKARAVKLEKIATVEQYNKPKYTTVSVEWKRSSVWGYNPTAEVRADKRVTTDKASGCGYDKESAAIAGAMNQNPEIMRILYEHAENGLSFPYSVNLFAGVPYFGGGCGVLCFKNVFEACGYDWRDVSHGKTYDCYSLEAK